MTDILIVIGHDYELQYVYTLSKIEAKIGLCCDPIKSF